MMSLLLVWSLIFLEAASQSITFQCPSAGPLIYTYQLCNGVVDCTADSRDEAACFEFKPYAKEQTFSSATTGSVLAAHPAADLTACLRQVVSSSIVVSDRTSISSGFVFNAETSTCTIFTTAFVSAQMNNAATTFSALSGAILYVRPRSNAAFAPCNDIFSCSGHGTAVNTGGSCSCVCNTGFSLGDCSAELSLGSLQRIMVLFPSAQTSRVKMNAIAEGTRRAVSEAESVSCEYPQVAPRSMVAVACSIVPEKLSVVMLSSDGMSKLNTYLASVSHPSVSSITARTVEATASFRCTVDSAVSLLCSSPLTGKPNGPFGNLRLTFGTASALPSTISLTLRRQSVSTTTTMTCLTVRTATSVNGCFLGTCTVTFSQLSNITSIAVALSSGTVTTGSSCYVAPALTAYSLISVPRVVNETTSAVYDDSINKIFVNISFALAGAVLFCLIAAIMCCCFELQAVEKIQEQHKGNSTVRDYVKQLFHCNVRYEEKRCWRTEDAAPIFALLFMNFSVACVLVALVALTFPPITSHTALFEVYRDSFCNASSFAPVPSLAAVVNSTFQVECGKLSSLGTYPTNLFASVKCTDSGKAFLSIGRSLRRCHEQEPAVVDPGSCLPLSAFFTGASGYLRLTCGAEADIAVPWSTLSRLDGPPKTPAFTSLRTSVLPAPLALPKFSNGLVLTPFVQKGGVVQVSASSVAARFESYATALSRSAAAGEMDFSSGLWLVLQTNDTYASPGAPGIGRVSGALERAFASVVSTLSVGQLSALANATIPSQDYPAGTIFNSFGSSGIAPKQDSLAGPGAHRFFNIKDTSADLGAVMDARPWYEVDQGYSISFKLRATKATRGFVFAITDAYEDVRTRTSPLLQQLSKLVQPGSAGTDWLPSFIVYGAVYLDGPEGLLSYMALEPAGTAASSSAGAPETLTNVQWDFAELGIEFILNGFWHDVHALFREENSRTKVQLVVDGTTSRISPGWSQCLSRSPRAIRRLAGTIPVLSNSERVFEGGELIVGYLNGGVSDLTFTPQSVSFVALLAGSSNTVQSAKSPDLFLSLILALLLFAVAGLSGLLTFVTSGLDLYRASRQMRLTTALASCNTYYNIMARGVEDSNEKTFEPIRYVTAKRWLGVTDRQFAALIEEICENKADPARELFRTLYATRCESSGVTVDLATIQLPHCEKWGATVKKDEDEPEVFFFCFKRTRLEEDPVASGDLQRGNSMLPQAAKGSKYSRTAGNIQDGAWGHMQARAKPSAASSSGASSSSSSGPSVSTQLFQAFIPVIVTMQTAYVYMTTVQVPPEYRQQFESYMSFIAIDLTVTFPRVPETVTPLLQVIIGVFVISLYFYFSFLDQRVFLVQLARYTLKRDVIRDWSKQQARRADTTVVESATDSAPRDSCNADAAEKAVMSLQEIAGHVKEEQAMTALEHELAIPFSRDLQCEYQCQARVLPVDEAKRIDLFSESSAKGAKLEVADGFGFTFSLQKRVICDENDNNREVLAVTSIDSSRALPVLEPLGVKCLLHKCRLTPDEHSDIYPFAFQQSCCVYVHGSRCNVSQGTIYSCPFVSETTGRPCEYAICAKHFRASLADDLISKVLGMKRAFAQHTWSQSLAVAILFLINAAYTPLVQTALMIVSCHPNYQCQFPLCYSTKTTLFYGSVTLASALLLFLGLGYPLWQYQRLRGRKAGLEKCFFSPEYNGRYTSQSGTVLDAEWNRFASCDRSALSQAYVALKFNWLFLSPFLLMSRFVLILPSLVLEPDSSHQRIGVATVQIVNCGFVFLTAPFLSPIANTMNRVSSIHQLLILGLLNMSIYSNRQSLWTTLMIFVTLAYLCFCAACIIWIFVVPLLRDRLDLWATTAKLKVFGMQYSKSASLFLVPSAAHGFTCEQRADVDSDHSVTAPSGRLLLKMFGLETKPADAPVVEFEYAVQKADMKRQNGSPIFGLRTKKVDSPALEFKYSVQQAQKKKTDGSPVNSNLNAMPSGIEFDYQVQNVEKKKS